MKLTKKVTNEGLTQYDSDLFDDKMKPFMLFYRQVFDSLGFYRSAPKRRRFTVATGILAMLSSPYSAPASNYDTYFPRGQYPTLSEVQGDVDEGASEEGLLSEIKVLSSEIQRGVRDVAQKRNMTCFGDPCLFQAFPLLYSKPNSGFFGGFRANLTNISRQNPYLYTLNAQVTRSDTRQWLSFVNLDIPQIELRALQPRLKIRGVYARSTEFRYVGEGRISYELNKHAEDEDRRYSLEETSAGGTVLVPIRQRAAGHFGLYGSYDYSSVRNDPFVPASLLYRLRPDNFDGGTFRSAGLGLYWDSRPTETFTRNGEMFEIGVSTGRLDQSGAISYRFTLVDRRYHTVKRWTLAHRLTMDGVLGESPFWIRAGVGGIDPIRDVSGSGLLKAYTGGRFHERYKLLESLELRLHQNEFRAFGLRGDLALMPIAVDFGMLNQIFAWSVASGFDVLWNRSFFTRLYAAFTEEEWTLRLKFTQEF
jgi:hypothetical protein